jgi:hypothetical protein
MAVVINAETANAVIFSQLNMIAIILQTNTLQILKLRSHGYL